MGRGGRLRVKLMWGVWGGRHSEPGGEGRDEDMRTRGGDRGGDGYRCTSREGGGEH